MSARLSGHEGEAAQILSKRRGVVLKEKDMKRNLTVLVLLVMWLLLTLATVSSAATTGQIPEMQGSSGGSSQQDDGVVPVNGAVDDGDPEGDPGDAGDGYGIVPQPERTGFQGAGNGSSIEILDEFILILMSLVSLVL
jgi:hypothetical protein